MSNPLPIQKDVPTMPKLTVVGDISDYVRLYLETIGGIDEDAEGIIITVNGKVPSSKNYVEVGRQLSNADSPSYVYITDEATVEQSFIHYLHGFDTTIVSSLEELSRLLKRGKP